jgi:hypothetical protein
MGKLLSLLLIPLFLSGCAVFSVDPGPNPALLTVRIDATLPKPLAAAFMQEAVLSPQEAWRLKYGGLIRGPWWSIGVYRRTPAGGLESLLPPFGSGLIDESIEKQESWRFIGARTFAIPSGEYEIEVWLSAYMHYCLDMAMRDCATPPVKIWRLRVPRQTFAGGQETLLTLDGAELDAKD